MLSLAMLLPAVSFAKADEEPVLTAICYSDLNMDNTFSEELSSILAQSKEYLPDVMLFGGDITANTAMTADQTAMVLNRLSEENDKITKNVLYAAGNEDYFAGEAENYNSADFYERFMAKNLGRLSDSDCYTEMYKGKEFILAYYYKICGYDFFVINPSPRDVQGNSKEYNFTYTSGTLTWLSKKMNEIDVNGEQLMFLLAHYPLEDTSNLSNKSGLLYDCTAELRNICGSHVNLIYLYANDETNELATDKRVTEYTTDGKKLVSTQEYSGSIPLSSMWTFRETKGGMQIINCATGLYLNEKLEFSGEETVWQMEFKNNIAYITLSDGRGLRLDEKTGAFSVGTPSPLEVYCLTSDDYTDSVMTCVEKFYSNYDYLIVGASGLMMTNLLGEKAETLQSERVYINNFRATAVMKKQAKSGEMGFISCYTGSLAGENKQALLINVYSDRTVLKLISLNGDTEFKEYVKYHTVLNKKKINMTGYSEEKEKITDFLVNIGIVAAVGLVIGIIVDIAIMLALKKEKNRTYN